MNSLAAVEDTSPAYHSSYQKPTVIFIPGAFHTPAHFGPLSRHLEAQGCENFSIKLPSIGEKAGTAKAGLAQDVATIRAVLEELVWDGEGGDVGGNWDESVHRDAGRKDIVLVMHSSGAVPGCQAVASLERSARIRDRKKGGVVGLVFIGGFLVEEGESLESMMLGLGEEMLPEYKSVEGSILRPSDPGPIFFSDLPLDKAACWESHLKPQSASVYTTAVRNTCWELKVPVTYIACTKDPQARVKNAIVAKMKRANWSIKTIEAGHSPFLSLHCLDELADLILKAGR